MVYSKGEFTGKKCSSCEQDMKELFDSYSSICPECTSEYKQVLIQAEGVWVWK